mmetsp:Transcript_175689/g.557990  ORF Transcript_175689/g.557990 Transcript_175689/m.557990 type:complete len:291 (+) Transcript_175689:3-875(+)
MVKPRCGLVSPPALRRCVWAGRCCCREAETHWPASNRRFDFSCSRPPPPQPSCWRRHLRGRPRRLGRLVVRSLHPLAPRPCCRWCSSSSSWPAALARSSRRRPRAPVPGLPRLPRGPRRLRRTRHRQPHSSARPPLEKRPRPAEALERPLRRASASPASTDGLRSGAHRPEHGDRRPREQRPPRLLGLRQSRTSLPRPFPMHVLPFSCSSPSLSSPFCSRCRRRRRTFAAERVLPRPRRLRSPRRRRRRRRRGRAAAAPASPARPLSGRGRRNPKWHRKSCTPSLRDAGS